MELNSATDSYQIDVISNDSKFSDQFMNKASRITALNFVNNDLINNTLSEVEDDYDVCIIDCSPGRFMLHDNIFTAADLLLIPNIPAPLSVYCNDILISELSAKMAFKDKILSFYNMVQPNKNLHKFYLAGNESKLILSNYIPFYTEIENINLNKESIFHQLKDFKTTLYYKKLWVEICDRMQWPHLKGTMGLVVNIDDEKNAEDESNAGNELPDSLTKTSNG